VKKDEQVARHKTEQGQIIIKVKARLPLTTGNESLVAPSVLLMEMVKAQ